MKLFMQRKFNAFTTNMWKFCCRLPFYDHVLDVSQESYVILEKVIRSLANFYSKAGPSAPLSQEVKSEILDYLNTAEDFL